MNMQKRLHRIDPAQAFFAVLCIELTVLSVGVNATVRFFVGVSKISLAAECTICYYKM